MSRAMKDSGVPWIGSIPENWETASLRTLFHQRKSQNSDGGEKNLLSLSYGNIIQKDINSTFGLLPENFNSYNVVESGDIVLRLTDLQNDQRSLRTGLVRTRGIITSAYVTISPSIRVCERYFHLLLHAADICKIFYNLGNGVRQNLQFKDLRMLPLIQPSIEEQQRIADFLDVQTQEVDAAIVKTRESIEEYKKLKQAVITQAVTKGIRPNRSMKDSGVEWIGEIPEEWAVKPLLFYFLQRKNQNSLGTEKNLLSLSYGEIIQKDINTSFGLLPENFNGYNIVERDDIVLRLTDLQNDQKSMRTGLVKARGIITSAYVTIHAVRKINASYFQKLLHAADVCKFFYNLGSGVRQSLKYSDLTQIRLLEPSLSEQQEIVAYLDEKCGAIDALIEKKQQIVTELESYKKSLIYEYVTGKKEVPA